MKVLIDHIKSIENSNHSNNKGNTKSFPFQQQMGYQFGNKEPIGEKDEKKYRNKIVG
jgi:hypothetical protein